MQRARPLQKLQFNILKPLPRPPCTNPRQRLILIRILSLRRLCRSGLAPIPLPGLAELPDLLRGQFAILIRVRFGKPLECLRPLLFGVLSRSAEMLKVPLGYKGSKDTACSRWPCARDC